MLTETEIVLEKDLHFFLIQHNIIDPELRNDFNEFGKGNLSKQLNLHGIYVKEMNF